MQKSQGSNEIDWAPITSDNGQLGGGQLFPPLLFGQGREESNNGLLSGSSHWSAQRASLVESLSAWESLDNENYSRLFAKEGGERRGGGLGSGSSSDNRGDFQFTVEPSIAADISAMLSEDFPASSLPGAPAPPVAAAPPQQEGQDDLDSLLGEAMCAPTDELSISTAAVTQKRRREEEELLFPSPKKARQAETARGFVSMASLAPGALQEPGNTVPATQFLVQSTQGASKLLSESSSDLIKQFLDDCSSGELRLLMEAQKEAVGGGKGVKQESSAAVAGNSFSAVLKELNRKRAAVSGTHSPIVQPPELLSQCAGDSVTTGVCVRMFHRSKGNHKWEETNTAPPKIGKMRKIAVTISNPAKPMRVLCKVIDISTGEHMSTCKLSTRSSCKKEDLLNELELSVPRSPEPITVFCFLKPTWGAKTAHVPRFSIQLSLCGDVASVPIHSFEIAVASHKYESNTGRKFAGPAPVSSVVLVS